MGDWEDYGGGHQKLYAENSSGAATALQLEDNSLVLETCTLGEAMALKGNGICRWVYEFSPGSGTLVGTHGPVNGQPGLYYQMEPDDIIMISHVCMELTSDEDSVMYQMGYTARGTAAGTFTPLTPWHHLESGSNKFAAWSGADEFYNPPIRVLYNAGTAESITIRMEANDASTTVVAAWQGFKVS